MSQPKLSRRTGWRFLFPLRPELSDNWGRDWPASARSSGNRAASSRRCGLGRLVSQTCAGCRPTSGEHAKRQRAGDSENRGLDIQDEPSSARRRAAPNAKCLRRAASIFATPCVLARSERVGPTWLELARPGAVRSVRGTNDRYAARGGASGAAEWPVVPAWSAVPFSGIIPE